MTEWVSFHSSASNSAWVRLRLGGRPRRKPLPGWSPGAGPRVVVPTTGTPAPGRAVSAGDADAGANGNVNGEGPPDADAPAIACHATRISAPTTAISARTIHSSGARNNLRMRSNLDLPAKSENPAC